MRRVSSLETEPQYTASTRLAKSSSEDSQHARPFPSQPVATRPPDFQNSRTSRELPVWAIQVTSSLSITCAVPQIRSARPYRLRMPTPSEGAWLEIVGGSG